MRQARVSQGSGQVELRELRAALRTAYDLAFDEAFDSGRPPSDQAEALVDAARRALVAAQALSDGPGETGCPEHPRGAVDPLYGDRDDPLPPGWGRCLLCNDRRRRAASRPRQPR